MQAILGIIGFIFVMGLAVLVHEIGHFVTARRYGVLCHEFAIGMGPIVWKKRKGETLYTIRAIPIGGFVSMGTIEGERDIFPINKEISVSLDSAGVVTKLHFQPENGDVRGLLATPTLEISQNLEVVLIVDGERQVFSVSEEARYVDSAQQRELQIVPESRMLEKKPKLQRLIIMAAGAIMNFVLAYVLVIIVGFGLGEVVGHTNQLSFVNSDGPAYVAGLQADDYILTINGATVFDGDSLTQNIQLAGANPMTVVFERAGVLHETVITPTRQGERYMIGINIGVELERSFAGAFRYANAQWWHGATLIVSTLQMLGTGAVGVNELSGPVGIAYMTSHFAMQGFLPLLVFASLININLGIFNLLPLPALDGGHITFIAVEAIAGKPVSPKIQNRIAMVGFALFMALFVFTFFNDIWRLFIR